MAEKLTKKKLLQEMDEKLQELNLLKSALEGDPARKQEELQYYRKQFYSMINKKK
jgi:phage terminase large subunit